MQIEYEISEQDFLEAQKLALKNLPNRRTSFMLRILPFWGVFLLAALAWALLRSGVTWNLSMSLALSFGLLGVASPWFMKNAQKKMYRKSPNLHGPRTMVVDDQGLSFNGPNFSSQLKWPFFVKFAEDERTFVLFQSNQIFHPIPKQLSEQEISELREIFTRNIAAKGKAAVG